MLVDVLCRLHQVAAAVTHSRKPLEFHVDLHIVLLLRFILLCDADKDAGTCKPGWRSTQSNSTPVAIPCKVSSQQSCQLSLVQR